MHADEHGAAVAVGAAHAVVEIDEGVIGAHEDGAETAAEFGADALRHVEREVFFALAGVAADGSGVLAAVAGVDDDGVEALGAGAVAPVVTSAGSGAGCQQDGAEEEISHASVQFRRCRFARPVSGWRACPGFSG